jgi:CDGSH-type Zn-finger protein
MTDKECICGQTSNDNGTCDGSHNSVCDDNKLNNDG